MIEQVITVEDRGGHDGAANGGHYGHWARIWGSRPDVAQVEVVREEHDYWPGRLARHHDRLDVRVTIDPTTLLPEDYVLAERWADLQPALHRYHPKYPDYVLVAGELPAWAGDPGAWETWVAACHQPASDWLRARARTNPQRTWLARTRRYERLSLAVGAIEAWEEVADAFGVERPSDQTEAGRLWMPVKIALDLGWVSPPPPPVLPTREEAGAVLLAGPEGVAPAAPRGAAI